MPLLFELLTLDRVDSHKYFLDSVAIGWISLYVSISEIIYYDLLSID